MKNLVSLPKFTYAQADISAGVVVFLVALPLCMGIALASGAPVISGLVAGVVGGIVIAFFSGSELSVSGPAAGLAAVVSSAIASLGSFEIFLVSVVIAGLLQVIIGFLRAGFLAEFVPNSVIRGMLAGIGLVIIIKQVPHLLGWDDTPDVVETSVHLFDGHFLEDLIPQSAGIEAGAMLIGLVCLTFLVVWDMPFRKRLSWTAFIPGPLVAVILGTMLNEVLLATTHKLGLEHGTQHLVQIPLLSAGAQLLTYPDFGALFSSSTVWVTAVTIAVVASIETLLCIEATDKLDPMKRISDPNRELVAQGIGNTLSGLLGGLPITSVIVRSSTNIYSGGKTRLSTLVHGLLILGSVLLIPEILNRVPLTCLAAILILIGYKLTSLQIIRESWERGADQFVPFGATILAVVFTDLLTGIGLGLALSFFWVVRANRHVAISTQVNEQQWIIQFLKDVSFVNKSELKRTLQNVPDNVRVVFDGTRASVIDHDIYEIIGEFAQAATYRGISVEYVNLFGKRTLTGKES